MVMSLWPRCFGPACIVDGGRHRATLLGETHAMHQCFVNVKASVSRGGSVAEWLACWTQAQKGLGSNRSRDAVG